MNKIHTQRPRLYNPLQKLALLGFLLGSDNYGEDIIRVQSNLEYCTVREYWTITVLLRESDTHTSTSSIGFYEYKPGQLTVYSSKNVITVGITPEIRKYLDDSKNEAFFASN